MSNIVLALAASHSPQVSTAASVWRSHGQRDRTKTYPMPGGRQLSYEELLAEAGDLAEHLTDDAFAVKAQRVDEAIEALRGAVTAVRPDVIVVIGDDQKELFKEELIAPFSIFTGPSLADLPLTEEARGKLGPGMAEAIWAWHGDEVAQYKVDRGLAVESVRGLMAAGFDVANSSAQLDGRSLGHAFTYPKRRLYPTLDVPILPVFVNTYYPPNQPSPKRCLEFGQALGRVLRDSHAERIAIVATGGLSHFVVDERGDRALLAALRDYDVEAIAAIDSDYLLSGSSEALNWIVLAGIVNGELPLATHEYMPGYRTPAGTGVGLAFARWQEDTK